MPPNAGGPAQDAGLDRHLKFALPAALVAPLLGAAGRLVGRWTMGSPGALVGALPIYRLMEAGFPVRHTYGAALVCWVRGAWLLVTVVLLCRWCRGPARFRREAMAGAGPLTVPLAQGIRRTAAMVGVDPTSVAVVPTESEGPGILGFSRPLFVIPRTLEASLSPAEFDAILVHEWVHLRRGDHLWGTVRTVFLSVFWYNPVVWLLCRSVALETEKACDEEVVRITGAPGAYADGLLKTVRHSLGLLDGSLTGAAGHSVSSRLKSILNPKPLIKSQIMKTLALCAASLVAVLGVYADASRDTPSDAAGTATYDISQVSVMPKILSQARPAYPADLRAHGVEGDALVDFVVDTQGVVKNAFAVKCSSPDFGKAAVEATSQWKFSPGQVAGKNVCTHMQVPIVFTLNADSPAKKP